jgi:hypothetical protein
VNQKKAKRIRAEMQDVHGATKSKQYFRFKDSGAIISDEPRRMFKSEKKIYKSLTRKQRAEAYPRVKRERSLA